MRDKNVTTNFLDLVTHEILTEYVVDDVHLSDLTIYNADFSPFRLRLSTEVPCIRITEDDIRTFGHDRILNMAQQELYVRQERPGSSMILVESKADFLKPLNRDPHWAIIFDEQQMQRFINHTNPKRAFEEAIQKQIPLRFLSPYEPNHPVTGSQFYGRNTELNLVLGHPDRSFSIEGGRRIGKTSLLKEIRRRMRSKMPVAQHDLLVWYDFWGYDGIDAFLTDMMRHFDFVSKLARGDLADYFPRFVKIIKKKYGGRVVFFLDEIDDLIDYERKHGYRLLSLLRKVAIDDDCSCILTGFRQLTSESYRANTPLNFCERISLTNLKVTSAKAVLVAPMQSMGVKLPAVVFRRILHDTGGHPQLLQLFGHSLIQLLDRDSSRIATLDHVNEIVDTGAVYDKLVETLVDNTSDLEFALVSSLARQDDFSQADMNRVLKSRGIDLSIKEINQIFRTLEGIGVIRRVGHHANVFHFAIPLQPALAARQQDLVELAWEKAQLHYV